MEITKICTGCGKKKVLSEYDKAKHGNHKRAAKCKVCKKTWRVENKDRKREIDKKWRDNNKEKKKLDDKLYRERNKEKLKQYFKSYRERNKEKIAKTLKKWSEDNKDKVNEYSKNKKKEDPEYKMKANVRTLFYQALKYNTIKKTDRFFKYTGIEIDYYIEHLKKSEYWNDFCNNKKIHIDHIIPCSAYDFNDTEEIKMCWNPENLRLLPAKENLEKYNKIDKDLIKKHGIEHLLPESLIE